MRRIAVRQVVLFTAAAVVVLGFAAGLWLLSGEGARADPATVVGIDVETTGNSATALGDIDTCITKAENDDFLVDVYVDDIPSDKSLWSLGYILYFDEEGDRLELNDQDHDYLLGAFGAGSPNDASEGVPDADGSPHTVSVTEYDDPEMGVTRGVLGRYTLKVKDPAADGLAYLTLEAVSLSGPEGVVTVSEVGSAIIAIDGAACPTPTATPSPSPTPSPTPEPSTTPSPTPEPTLSPAPTRTLSMPTRGWHNFVWTGASATDTATVLNCIAGMYNIAYQWVATETPAQWLRYVPGQPALSSITTVNQYDAMWVLTTADGVTCSMPVAAFPSVTTTPTPTPSPTPTPTPTP